MASALQPALDAVVAKIEAITPQHEFGTLFQRKGKEKLPVSTRAPARLFDLDFEGLSDVAPFRGSRIAAVRIVFDYPVGRAEAALETQLALDSEDLVRALTAAGAWAGNPVLRVGAATTVDRTKAQPVPGQGPGILQLVLAASITYADDVGDP